MRRRPYLKWSLLGVAMAGVTGLTLQLATGLSLVGSYAVAINAATLLLYLADKGLAPRDNAPRVPNAVLVLMALVGGSAGAILGVMAGHKTSRRYLWLRALLVGFLVGHLALVHTAVIDPCGP